MDDDPTVDMQHDLRVTAGAIQLERLRAPLEGQVSSPYLPISPSFRDLRRPSLTICARAPLEGQPMFALTQAVAGMESLRQVRGRLQIGLGWLRSAPDWLRRGHRVASDRILIAFRLPRIALESPLGRLESPRLALVSHARPPRLYLP